MSEQRERIWRGNGFVPQAANAPESPLGHPSSEIASQPPSPTEGPVDASSHMIELTHGSKTAICLVDDIISLKITPRSSCKQSLVHGLQNQFALSQLRREAMSYNLNNALTASFS